MVAQYADKIREIAYKTFEIVCYMFPLEPWELEEMDEIELPANTVKSIVTFDGAAAGGMIINPSSELLEAIATNMLGADMATPEEKEGALCEMANIICGNTVPLFAKNSNICYIRPPRIAEQDEDTDQTFRGMHKETLKVFLDEGIAEIMIYYSNGEQS